MNTIFTIRDPLMFIIGIPVASILGYLLCKLVDYIILINCNIVSKDYLADKNLTNMYKLYEKHKKLINSTGTTYTVSGFYIDRNVFRFKNIGTDISDGGCCFGFAYLTKHIFQGDIDKLVRKKEDIMYDISFINKNLNKYGFDDETAELVYGSNKEKSSDHSCQYGRDKANYLLGKNEIKLSVPEDIFKKVYDDYYKFIEHRTNSSDREIVEIVNAIEYYQYKFDNFRKEFKIIFGKYSTFKNKTDAIVTFYTSLFLRFSRKDKLISVDKIKESIINDIRKDKLVIVGIRSPVIGGHAVVAYKYEIVNKNTVKVYVYDCNIPLFSSECIANNSIDEDIINNTYILLIKVDGKWQYIYSPIINDNFMYEGIFNSYVPNSQICIIDKQ